MRVKKRYKAIFPDIPIAFICKRGMYICQNGNNPLIVEGFRQSGKFQIWHWYNEKWIKNLCSLNNKCLMSDTNETISITARTYEQLKYLQTII